jgi:hypothetical protein
LVWESSIDIVQGLFEDVWGGQDVITIDHCVDITLPVRVAHSRTFGNLYSNILQIALFVIGAAGTNFSRLFNMDNDAGRLC